MKTNTKVLIGIGVFILIGGVTTLVIVNKLKKQKPPKEKGDTPSKPTTDEIKKQTTGQKISKGLDFVSDIFGNITDTLASKKQDATNRAGTASANGLDWNKEMGLYLPKHN